jgi:Uma2 family endonuclease
VKTDERAGPRSPQMTYEGVRRVIQRTYPAYDVEIREGEYYIVAPHDMFSSNVVMRLGWLLGAWNASSKLGNLFDSNVVPELVVEVRSSRQTERATRRKLETLMAKGVDVGVYIDPGPRVVEVHRPGQTPVSLAPGDRFEIPDILPGFSVFVDELWPE